MSVGSRRWFGLVALTIGVAMIIIDATIVNVAIPSIDPLILEREDHYARRLESGTPLSRLREADQPQRAHHDGVRERETK